MVLLLLRSRWQHGIPEANKGDRLRRTVTSTAGDLRTLAYGSNSFFFFSFSDFGALQQIRHARIGIDHKILGPSLCDLCPAATKTLFSGLQMGSSTDKEINSRDQQIFPYLFSDNESDDARDCDLLPEIRQQRRF